MSGALSVGSFAEGTIPFNRAWKPAAALDYLRLAYDQWMTAGDGPFGRQCERILEEVTGCQRALLTTSCTHALEMCGLVLGLRPGDEIIVPSFTFVSTAAAFSMRGARPVFVDIRADTLNIDESKIEAAITGRTRAIVLVHYAGVACEMDRILEIAAKHSIPIIEDNAHGLFGSYHGRPLGSFGALATLSFHETKNLSCGEGGALLLNDPGQIVEAEIIREKGTNRKQFAEGRVDKYSWVAQGSSYVLSDLLGAVLFAALEERAATQASRHHVWSRYRTELADWCGSSGVGMQRIPAGIEHPAHLFSLLMPSAGHRREFIERLRQRAIHAVFHYVPLEKSTMAAKLGAQGVECPVSNDVSSRLVRLPLYTKMSDDEVSRVIDEVQRITW